MRFSLETRKGLRVFGDVARREFQRYDAVQADVLRFVNHAHTSAAGAFHVAIVREVLFKQRIVAGRVLHISGCDQR